MLHRSRKDTTKHFNVFIIWHSGNRNYKRQFSSWFGSVI